MVYFTQIEPSDHYTQEHEKDVPWHKVIEIIFSVKNPREKEDKLEIEKDGYYILFQIRGKVLYVINAKKI